jgi:succinyl-diaminopimelate desuccinylase
MPKIEAYLASHRDRFESELAEFLRIPTVSAEPTLKAEVARGAQWVAESLRRLGLLAEVIPTDTHPLVYAESPPVPGAPVILVYGHYDVQPADPVELWTSPPFEPVVRNGNLYARGSTDDKGQVFTHIKSAEAWMAVEGRLPVQLKFLIEGEEEVGSAALEKYIATHAERLACDAVVVSDGAQFAPGVPAITYGLRGIAYYELRFTGPNRDLHSGVFGGSVTNPANALAKVLAAMVDGQGRITIPGFYDDVLEISPQEREQLAALEFDEAAYLRDIGVDGLSGETGYSTLERRWTRPTFDVNGLWSGYQGEGAKTVLPSKAGAKFSFRLVPNQDPHQVTVGLKALLGRIKPPGISMELLDFHGAPATVFSLDSPYITAASRAIEQAFGRRPVYTREGGSIPIVSTFHNALGVDILLVGWGQNDDNAHSPDEKFSLADFHAGIRASAELWRELAKIKAH